MSVALPPRPPPYDYIWPRSGALYTLSARKQEKYAIDHVFVLHMQVIIREAGVPAGSATCPEHLWSVILDRFRNDPVIDAPGPASNEPRSLSTVFGKARSRMRRMIFKHVINVNDEVIEAMRARSGEEESEDEEEEEEESEEDEEDESEDQDDSAEDIQENQHEDQGERDADDEDEMSEEDVSEEE